MCIGNPNGLGEGAERHLKTGYMAGNDREVQPQNKAQTNK